MADTPLTVAKLSQVQREETSGLHPRLLLMYFAGWFLPRRTGHQARAALLRTVGFSVGGGTSVRGLPHLTGSHPGAHGGTSRGLWLNLVVGRNVVLHPQCVLDLEERITIGDGVVVGPQAMILTSTHDLGPKEHRAGPVTRTPVTIGDGAWLGARCIILPGVTIGEGAIVNPGSVVNKDVAAHTRVGGTPARQVEVLDAAAPPAA
jgi:acetyltransferase-like isoleucine patch superfamily enzyme